MNPSQISQIFHFNPSEAYKLVNRTIAQLKDFPHHEAQINFLLSWRSLEHNSEITKLQSLGSRWHPQLCLKELWSQKI